MKNKILFTLFLLALAQCKNKPEKQDILPGMDAATPEEQPASHSLRPGCYSYLGNGNLISFEITETVAAVRGRLTYELAGKDRNSGTFEGHMKGDTLIGNYSLRSEGSLSSREVAFLVEANRLLEGYAELSADGSAFKDTKELQFSSAMPLARTECPPLNPEQ
jgi:hypothetical protein